MKISSEASNLDLPTYKGQFGVFSITASDRWGVWIYRAALNGAALSFALGVAIVLGQGGTPWSLQGASVCYGVFWLCLGIALATIHIYLVPLHRLLQVFWGIGGAISLWLAWVQPDPLVLYVYQHPFPQIGIGFSFAALTGIYFKEAFCFDRLETKFLTPLVPGLILGHLLGLLPIAAEKTLLAIWAILFVVFGLRKWVQTIASDIGDKSVFEYLKSGKPLPS